MLSLRSPLAVCGVASMILFAAPSQTFAGGTLFVDDDAPVRRTMGRCIVFEDMEIIASDAEKGDLFGVFVDLCGDTAIVGALGDSEKGDNAGAAYIYRFIQDSSQWREETKLLAADARPEDWFGHSVGISGDVAVVGSYRNEKDGSTTFRLHFFRFDGSTWLEEQVVQIPESLQQNFFNVTYPVAIDNDVAIIGAYGEDKGDIVPGAIYVYRYQPTSSTWTQEDVLFASDSKQGLHLGQSVAISGSIIVAGTPTDNDLGDFSGSAYVFRYDSQEARWVEEGKLLARDGSENDQFGWAVGVDNDLVVVGANRDDDAGVFAGSTYVFRYNADIDKWEQEAKLLPDDIQPGDIFGFAVAVAGDLVVATSIRDDVNGIISGSGYVFQFRDSAWTQQAKFLASDGAENDWLGMALAVSGGTAIVATPLHDDQGDSSGAAYFYSYNELCEVLGDLDGDGTVGVKDLLILLGNWGPCADCKDCPADLNGDCTVGVKDLLILLGNWG